MSNEHKQCVTIDDILHDTNNTINEFVSKATENPIKNLEEFSELQRLVNSLYSDIKVYNSTLNSVNAIIENRNN